VNYAFSTGNYEAWNAGWAYRNDGVDIGTNTDGQGNGLHVGYVRDGEWINYTITVDETANYSAKVRVAAPQSGGRFHFAIDGEDVTPIQLVTNTGAWTLFNTMEINDIILEAGTHVLTLFIDNDKEFNISNVQFERSGNVEEQQLLALNGKALDASGTIAFFVNQPLLATSLANSADNFTLKVNGEVQTITEVMAGETGEKSVILKLDGLLVYTDHIMLSYNGSTIQSTTGKALQPFTDLLIRNVLDPVFIIPGKVEAEDHIHMVGLSQESTSDVGGGSNIGYTDEGDFADYAVYVEHNGSYRVDVRFAAAWDEGRIGLYILNEDGSETEVVTVDSPVTGDWQSWTTVDETLVLPKGYHTLRMRVLIGGFNMNWMDFTLLEINNDIDTDGDGVLDEFDLCPGTVAGAMVDADGCFVFSLPADNFSIEAVGETCPDRNNGSIMITATESYDYVLKINNLSRPFPRSITLTGLAPDTYNFCIEVEGEDYEQCFSVEIPEGVTTSAKATVQKNKAVIVMETGSAPYSIIRNGELQFETQSPEFTLDVAHGDLIEVKTAVDCEGVFAKRIDLFDAVKAYPNPTSGLIEVALPLSQDEVEIELWSMMGQLISRKSYTMVFGKAVIDMHQLPPGVYMARVVLNEPKIVKIIKY
jgi:endoglucanase